MGVGLSEMDAVRRRAVTKFLKLSICKKSAPPIIKPRISKTDNPWTGREPTGRPLCHLQRAHDEQPTKPILLVSLVFCQLLRGSKRPIAREAFPSSSILSFFTYHFPFLYHNTWGYKMIIIFKRILFCVFFKSRCNAEVPWSGMVERFEFKAWTFK